jgi:tRNA pseudouridine38-40 synthase
VTIAQNSNGAGIFSPFTCKYKLTLAYDGTRYGGWQVQDNVVSIQSLLQTAIGALLETDIHVTGAGRTDAGVHALGQVAHCSWHPLPDLSSFTATLNALLPIDIRLLNIEPVSIDFHARYTACSKRYHYHLHLERTPNPFKSPYSVHIPYPIDRDLLQKASSLFIGTHDFTSFANEADRGSASHQPIKTIYRIDCLEEPGGIRIEFEGDGFLYKMVRIIVGTLLEVSTKKRSINEIPEIFAAKDRCRAGQTAPPQGLFLVGVNYESITTSRLPLREKWRGAPVNR